MLNVKTAREDMIRYHVTPAASLWPSLDEESDCRPQAASPTPSPNPLSVFTPFWARPDHGETLPAPVTITYVDYYPAPSDDDSDYWVYEDEDDDSFVEDRERPQAASPTPSPNPLSVFTPFWARPDHGETLPAPVTITYVDYYPAPSDDDSDYWVYEDEDDDSFVEDREVHPLRKTLRRRPQAASPTPSPNPLSVFTPFWARPDHGETLPAPVTITYVDYYPAPSDDDSDYWVYEDEDDDSFVEDREVHPLRKTLRRRPQAASPTPSPNPLSVFTPFWARPDHGETLPAPVTITYVDYYPAPSDDDSDYWVYEDEDDDSFVEDREVHPLRKTLRRRPQAASPTPSPNPLSVFTPFWARPDHGETLPAPVTITYVDYYPAPSDDDSDYWVYEDEDDDSFVEDREVHPLRKTLRRRPQAASPTPSPNPLSVFTPFWARPDHGETLPAPVTITYVDYYPVPSDDDSDYWVYEDEDDDSFVEDREVHPLRKTLRRRPQAASPTPSPNPLSVFTPFWARPDHGETLPAPVTITYVDYYPAPSDDDSDYWVYEDEDDDSFVEDREVHPLRKTLRRRPQAASPTPSPNPLSVFTPFWARPDHGETLPAPVTITYVDYYPAPSDDDSDYWVYEDEDDDSFVEDREVHPLRKTLRRRPQAASPTPSPNPLSVFTPFWARPDHGETLPAPVTITYVDYYPVPSDDDSDYWVYEDEDDDSFVEDREVHPLRKTLRRRPQAASPTPSPNPLSVFTPFWARPDHGETLPAPVTITYVDYYPAPSDDDSDYWVYEDEDDDSFVEDREVHPLRKALRRRPQAASPTPSPNPLSVFTPFWARPDHGETLPAPVTITYVDNYPAPSDDDSDYWVYEDEDDDSFVEDREVHLLRKALRRVAAFWRRIFS
ncbi:uncharacterized protein [Haliotis cracherodii]|uniref:uncharacterized protein n=1 Tax=Haliotis cracherodii TaxID=6455 RepID=UPI0039EACB83